MKAFKRSERLTIPLCRSKRVMAWLRPLWDCQHWGITHPVKPSSSLLLLMLFELYLDGLVVVFREGQYLLL